RGRPVRQQNAKGRSSAVLLDVGDFPPVGHVGVRGVSGLFGQLRQNPARNIDGPEAVMSGLVGSENHGCPVIAEVRFTLVVGGAGKRTSVARIEPEQPKVPLAAHMPLVNDESAVRAYPGVARVLVVGRELTRSAPGGGEQP